MIKRLIAIGGATALLLGAAVPVFAWGSRDVAIVNNSATAVADTGLNSQSNVADVSHGGGVSVSGSGDRYMSTGNATAYAGALVVANTHIGCGCDGVEPGHGGGGSHHTDFALVTNDANAGAYTGWNGQDNVALVSHGGGVDVDGSGDRTMYTGDASSTARAWTIVNTHIGE